MQLIPPEQKLEIARREPLTRFLSREEIAPLHEALDRQTRDRSRQQADLACSGAPARRQQRQLFPGRACAPSPILPRPADP